MRRVFPWRMSDSRNRATSHTQIERKKLTRAALSAFLSFFAFVCVRDFQVGKTAEKRDWPRNVRFWVFIMAKGETPGCVYAF